MLATPDTSWHRAHPPGLPSAGHQPRRSPGRRHRNLAAAYATTPATPPKSGPVPGITSPWTRQSGTLPRPCPRPPLRRLACSNRTTEV